MTLLRDILDTANLIHHIEAGTVAEVRHPTEPLTLFNYTNRCQFTGAWDRESRACRGLIVDDASRVVARPFPKFHNLYEHGPDSAAGPIELIPPLRVFDKLDGSLGIAYRRPSDGRVAWATRGSFTSEQAQWATGWWAENYPDGAPLDGVTWLAEIIYPANRIVLDYGDRSELVLLATLDNETGVQEHGDVFWPGRHVECFGRASAIHLVDRNDRPGAEGYVVLSADGVTRVKLKADEYMRLHKILTGVSNVTIWELLRNGDPLDVLYEKVPDEFAAWVRATVGELTATYEDIDALARAEFCELASLLDDRKAFAAEAVKSEHRALLFALADDKPLADRIWKQIKPERAMPYADVDT